MKIEGPCPKLHKLARSHSKYSDINGANEDKSDGVIKLSASMGVLELANRLLSIGSNG